MPQDFRVVYLQAALAGFRVAAERAEFLGLEEDVYQAGQIIDQQLRTHPREFGDPRNTMAHLSLDMYHRMISPLSIQYGIHQELPIVFVQTIRGTGPLAEK